MKVLHIISTLGSGGAEKMLVDIVKEMLSQNINCEVAILTRNHNFFEEELQNTQIPIYFGRAEKVYSIKNIFFLKKLIKKNNYDCVHTHLFAPQLFTPMALKSANVKIPLVTTEHSTHNKRRERKFFYFLDSWMYRQYEKIIAITDDTKLKLIDYLPSTKNKIIVIENGIDIQQYYNSIPSKREDISLDLTSDEIIVLMVAAMREQKDHETLIRASKLLPNEYRIVFVGDGERLEEVKEYAKQNGKNNILFLGTRKDVPSLMKASDIFVLSSKWEGFGLVVVEAASTGLPVIASNVEGLNEVVNTIGGQLFEPYNEIDLARKILNAKESQQEIFNVSKYTIEITVNKYLDVYKEILRNERN